MGVHDQRPIPHHLRQSSRAKFSSPMFPKAICGSSPVWPHSIQALKEGCEFLLVFPNGAFSENSTFLLTDWLIHVPREV